MIHSQVNAWYAQFDQEQDMFLVSLGECQDTDIMTYDSITKGLDIQLQRKSEPEDKEQFCSFQYITYHRLIKVSKSSYEVLVGWVDGSVT